MIYHSIIIPTAGRPNSVKTAVESVLTQKQSYPNTELIVVDNNSDPALAKDLSAYCNKWKDQLRYFHEPTPGLTAARHRGAAEAIGDILTFLDDDVELSDTWLSAIQGAFQNPAIVLVGGPSIPRFTSSIPSWFWDFLEPTPYGGWMHPWLSLLDIGNEVPNIDPNYVWGLNFSIRKQALYSSGGFNPDLVPAQLQRWQGDGETGLTKKIQKLGLRADYIQKALLYHLCGPERLNKEYFIKRAYYQGVCDSFAEIRETSQPPKSINRKLSMISYLKATLVNRSHSIIRIIKKDWQPWYFHAHEIKILTKQAELDGWNFHQREVQQDPELLNWVLKSDFFNADQHK